MWQIMAFYAVFGQVIKGMEVVDQIVKLPTTGYGSHPDMPKNPVKIITMQIKTKTK